MREDSDLQSVPYSERNIEDWDFRDCYIGSPTYDVEADLFLSTHYGMVVAVDVARLFVIRTFLEAGLAEFEEDGRHVRLLANRPDHLLSGSKSASSRFRREGRLERKVAEALRREYRKYGRLRLTLLPPKAEKDGAEGR